MESKMNEITVRDFFFPKGYSPKRSNSIVLMCGALALNFILGMLTKSLGVPLYLDTTGTFLVVILLGAWWGIAISGISIVLTTLLYYPLFITYSGTAFTIVLTVEACMRVKLFRNMYLVIFSGVIVGIVAMLASWPITVFVHRGSTGSPNDYLTILLNRFLFGEGNLELSALISGFITEPIDKACSAVLAYQTVKCLPQNFMKRYSLRGV
jgi:energy-coupling factor transport system substrate-specific component